MVVDQVIDAELRRMNETKTKMLDSGLLYMTGMFEILRAEKQFHHGLFELQDERYDRECYKPYDASKYLARNPSVGFFEIKW